MSLIIAVDPGASGGIARAYNGTVEVVAMPETRRDTIDLIRDFTTTLHSERVAYIEKISGFIPDGGASMMFNFGAAVERVGCILETLGVRIIEVPPKTWQKSLGLGIIERTKVPPGTAPEYRKVIKAANARARTEWKNKLKAEAQRRFPSCKVTLKTCDALLILDYAIRAERHE